MRFGFIGAGNMASAIIRGMTIGTKSYDGKDIFITSKSGTSAQRLAETCGATAVTTAAEVVAASDVLVLAVKPHILAAVLPALKEEIAAKKPLVVSIAAGKELAYLAELLPEGTPVVRIMPNINAKIGAATSGLCANALVTAEQKAVVKARLSRWRKANSAFSPFWQALPLRSPIFIWTHWRAPQSRQACPKSRHWKSRRQP